jgi:hypothetical protein
VTANKGKRERLKEEGRRFRVKGIWCKVNAVGKRMVGKGFVVQGKWCKVNAVGKRIKAKGSRRKRGFDAIIRFNVKRRLEFDRRENGNIGEKFQTANIGP